MLDSTLLISAAPKPVAVRACLGLEKSGPTGPLRSEIGALVDILRSRGRSRVPLVVAMVCKKRVRRAEGVQRGQLIEGGKESKWEMLRDRLLANTIL